MPENCNDFKIYGVSDVLKVARRMDIEKIVYMSRSSVYEDTPSLSIEKICVDRHSLPMAS